MYLLQNAFHLVFCLPHRLSPGSVHLTFFLVRALLLSSWHVYTTLPVSLWSYLSVVPLVPILSHLCFSCYLSLRLRTSIAASSSHSRPVSLLGLFVVDHVSTPIMPLPLFCISSHLTSRASLCHTTPSCTSSNFCMHIHTTNVVGVARTT